MDFLRFLWRHLWAAIAVVVGFALFVIGVLFDAYTAYQLGPPAWVWQLAGAAVIVGSMVAILYQSEARGPSGADPRDEERRAMIHNGRRLASLYAEGHGGNDTFQEYMGGRQSYLALRRHLSPQFREQFDTGPEDDYAMLEAFLNELDRLEEKWKLS